MLVTFPEQIARPTDEEMKFLTDLNNRAGYTTGNWRDNPMSLEDVTKMCSLIDIERGIVLHPWAHHYGYDYQVAHTTPKPKISDGKGDYIVVLVFDHTQLPSHFNFDSMADIFMREENVQRIIDCGFDAPTKDRARYEY